MYSSKRKIKNNDKDESETINKNGMALHAVGPGNTGAAIMQPGNILRSLPAVQHLQPVSKHPPVSAPVQGKWVHGAHDIADPDPGGDDYVEKYISVTEHAVYPTVRDQLREVNDNGAYYGDPLNPANRFLASTFDDTIPHQIKDFTPVLKPIVADSRQAQIGNTCLPTSLMLAEYDRTSRLDLGLLATMIGTMSSSLTTDKSSDVPPAQLKALNLSAPIINYKDIKPLFNQPLNQHPDLNYVIVHTDAIYQEVNSTIPMAHTMVLRRISGSKGEGTKFDLTVELVDPRRPLDVVTKKISTVVRPSGIMETVQLFTYPRAGRNMADSDTSRQLTEVISYIHGLRAIVKRHRLERSKKPPKLPKKEIIDSCIVQYDNLLPELLAKLAPLKTKAAAQKASGSNDLATIMINIEMHAKKGGEMLKTPAKKAGPKR